VFSGVLFEPQVQTIRAVSSDLVKQFGTEHTISFLAHRREVVSAAFAANGRHVDQAERLREKV
jgi:hypothetical protein